MNSRQDKQILGFYPLRRLGKDHGRSHSGFTLLEVMVTVAIIGVLVGLAIGGIQNLLPKFRLNAAARQIRGDMQKCKMAAVRNNTDCLMVFTEGNSTGDAGSYEACFDANDNDACDAGETIVLTGNLNDDDFVGVFLNEVKFGGFLDNNFFNFNSRGLSKTGNALGNGRVNCTNKNNDHQKINVFSTGRIRIE